MKMISKMIRKSNIIRLLIEILRQQINRIIGNDITNLEQSLIKRGHNKLHQIIPKRHFLNFLLTLILNHFEYFFHHIQSLIPRLFIFDLFIVFCFGKVG
jgi:hypothetical protein